ncbi:UNVERIFIED_CONTAM: hypothetical protein PYX00_002535 [Menopon gallinae]|uniref:Peroxin-19 n=1 Tax=Menopon gallinae TaxID=328185 RepID=A0AAW2IHR5_9NEOP
MAEKQETELSRGSETDEKLSNDCNKAKKTKKRKKKEKPQENEKSLGEDEELSELLDSALGDFESCSGPDDEEEKSEEKSKPVPPNSLWDEEFLRQAAEKLQQSFQTGFSAGDTPMTAEQLGQNIQSLAEAMTEMAGGQISPDMEFNSLFAQTLRQMSETTDSSRQFTEEDFNNIMSNLNNCFESPEAKDMFPLLFSMMENLLSKDVLYSDLKSIVDKYPQWLQDNKAKLPSDEYESHMKTVGILRQVCQELENEDPNESEQDKKERCDRILTLMLQVQDLGLIPLEIAGDLSPVLALDRQGSLQMRPNLSPNQCSIA